MTVVVVRPVVGVLPGHVAEARRALIAQGRTGLDVDDDRVRAMLWAARALPIALDALTDQGASVPLHEAHLQELTITAEDGEPEGPLWAVAVHPDNALLVEVRICTEEALGESDELATCPAVLALRFGLRAKVGSTVNIQRFVVGRG